MKPDTIFFICWYITGIISLLIMLTWGEGKVTLGNLATALLLGSIGPIPAIIVLICKYGDATLLRWSKKNKNL